MYLWRKLNDGQRAELLNFRRLNNRPWHSPLHQEGENGRYLLTAACYEHRHVIGLNPERLSSFSKLLLEVLDRTSEEVYALCVLPNHYHALVLSRRMVELLREISRLHGRTSFNWNKEEGRRGRKVWFNCMETAIKSDRHFWATLNYVHHNPVHHGYVRQWQDWPFSSATAYLNRMGRKNAASVWKEYPILEYGKDWDAPDM